MHMIGRVISFRNDETYFDRDAVLVELTDVQKDGLVEIAFDMPHKTRVYVALPLPDLIAAAVAFGKE